MQNRYAVIILAAGKATRFNGNKLLAQINDKRVLDYSLDVFSKVNSCDPIVVVTGAYDQTIREYLSDTAIQVVYNTNYETGGMISSIEIGMQVMDISKLDGVFIHPADTPFIEEHDIKGMIDFMQETKSSIVVPYDGRRRGHPVLVHSTLFPELFFLREENQGLRGLLDRFKLSVGLFKTDNAGIWKDIDQRSDLP